MTISYDLLRVSTTTADVAVPQLDQATLSEVSRSINPSDGSGTIIFTIKTGDNVHKTNIVSSIGATSRGSRSYRCTIAINTWAHSSDSVTGQEAWSEISVVLNCNIPKDVRVEAADLLALIGNTYGLTFTALSTKVPNSAVVDNWLFASPADY